MQQLLHMQVIRSTTPRQAEATVRLLLIAWTLQEQNGQRIRNELRVLHAHLHQQPLVPKRLGEMVSEPRISSWVRTSICVVTLRCQIAGHWSSERVWACLPRLIRFLCPSSRRRLHQETVIRTWLRQQKATTEPMT